MNNTIKFYTTVLVYLFTFLLISCSNSNEKFLTDYEKYVEQIENKVELKQDINYDECELEMVKFLDRYEELS